MVYNEKILCGLGRELEETGRLWPEGCARAMAALHRFMALAPGMRVGALAGVATAAVREADDGKAFRDRVEAETGIRLQIASGADEARLAAQGVLFGDPHADGVVVDLGGASMELCPIRRGRPGHGRTTPLGPQRLGDASRRAAIRTTIGRTLRAMPYDIANAATRLYLVGGAWRAFGRIDIRRTDHPLKILHEYTMTPDQAHQTAAAILDADRDGLRAMGAPSARVATMPHAALLMQSLLEQFDPRDVVLSGFGLREGVCYEYLPKEIRAQDPLLSTCRGQEQTRARAPGFGADLSDWLLTALQTDDEDEERLITAICHLVDVSWRAHPDYRDIACIEAVTRVNVSSVGHQGRAFMLGCLLARYKSGRRAANNPVLDLLDAETTDRALQIGALMRLGASIAGSVPGCLTECPLTLDEDGLTLLPTARGRVLLGEEVEKRLSQAARALSVDAQIVT